MCQKITVIAIFLLQYFSVVPANAQNVSEFSMPARSAAELVRDTAFIMRSVREASKINSDSAVQLLRRVANLSRQIGYNDGTANAMITLANIYVNNGKPDEGRKLLLAALPFCQKAFFKKHGLLIFWGTSMGVPYFNQGNYPKAMNYFSSTLAYLEKNAPSDTKSKITLYIDIGNSCYGVRNASQALYYWKKAEQLAIATGNDRQLPNIYNCIAAYYSAMKDYETSKKYCNYSISLAEKLGLPPQADPYFNLGVAHYYQEDFEASTRAYETCLRLFRNKPGKSSYATYGGLGAAYVKIGKYDQAEFYLKKSLDIATKGGFLLEKMTAYGNMADLYLHTKDYKKASEAYDNYIGVKDSLYNKEKQETVSTLDVRYRTAERDKALVHNQLLLTQQQSQLKQKNLWIGFISTGSLLLLALSGFFYQRYRNKQNLQARHIQTLQQEQEIGNLKSMMTGEEKERTRLARELHDGIMVQLSMVKMNLKTLPEPYRKMSSQDYFATEYFQRTVQQLEDATKELRQTAHNLMPDMLLKGGLADAVLYFCNNIGQNNRLKIDFQQYGEIPRLQPTLEISLYRIIQELVQNVIKHAHATKAIVQLSLLENGVLSVIVEDNGIGFDTERMNRNAGMGLNSIHTRVRALNGVLDLRSEPDNGTTIHLEFDIISMIQPNSLLHAD